MNFETAVHKRLASVQPKVKATTYAQYTAKLDKFILPYFTKKGERHRSGDAEGFYKRDQQ